MFGLISQEAVRSLGRDGLGIITPDITRSLGNTGYLDYLEGQLADEVVEPVYAKTPDVVALGAVTVVGIPLKNYAIVGALSAVGGATGGFIAARGRGALLGGLGGLLGGIVGTAIVGMVALPPAGATT